MTLRDPKHAADLLVKAAKRGSQYVTLCELHTTGLNRGALLSVLRLVFLALADAEANRLPTVDDEQFGSLPLVADEQPTLEVDDD